MTDFRVLLYKIKNGLKKRVRQVLEVYDLDFEIKDKYDIDDLLEVTRILRSENGCPWDREQDHKSVRMNVLEEAYEVMEAIDADDAAMLKEELGDLLFQAVFHCEIEKERGRFEFNDICDDVTKKMIYRHPHVFGDVNVNNSDDVLKNWDKLKKKSKHQDTVADTLDSVPMVLPALMRGEKVFKRASNAGVALSGTSEAVDLVKEKRLPKIILGNFYSLAVFYHVLSKKIAKKP